MPTLTVALLVLGCVRDLPAAQCDPLRVTPGAGIDCDSAVTAALQRLEGPHSPVQSIEFTYGQYCDLPERGCPLPDVSQGYVLLAFEGDARLARIDVWRASGAAGLATSEVVWIDP